MSLSDDLDRLRREVDSARDKLVKTPYLTGNGHEAKYANAYYQYAQLHNNNHIGPHIMVPRRRLRGG